MINVRLIKCTLAWLDPTNLEYGAEVWGAFDWPEAEAGALQRLFGKRIMPFSGSTRTRAMKWYRVNLAG